MAASVKCNQCNRQFAYKKELAGKRVKCKCGGRIEFPATEPLEELGELDLLSEAPPAHAGSNRGKGERLQPADPLAGVAPPVFEPEPGIQCRNCKAPLQPGAVVCLQCGCNQKSGAMMRTQVAIGQKAPPAANTLDYSRAAPDTSLSGGDWLLIVFCSGIAFIVGIIRLAQGRGPAMLIASIVMSFVWSAIRFALVGMQQAGR